MRTRIALLLPLLALAPLARADDAANVGRRAVTDLIERKLGRGVKVVFQTTNGEFVGANERRITGRGYTRQGRIGRDFTYDARARTDGSLARDLKVRFEDGATLSEAGPFYDRGNGGVGRDPGTFGRPTFRKPGAGFTDKDGDVTFSGDARGESVNLVIERRSGGRVESRRVDVRSGRWETNLRLAPGAYTARVSNPNVREAAQGESLVDFRVADGADRAGGSNDLRARFTKPTNGFADHDGDVSFEGASEGREVELRIFRGNREVATRRVSVSRGRWSARLNLKDQGRGEFRATVRDLAGNRTEEVRFSVVG